MGRFFRGFLLPILSLKLFTHFVERRVHNVLHIHRFFFSYSSSPSWCIYLLSLSLPRFVYSCVCVFFYEPASSRLINNLWLFAMSSIAATRVIWCGGEAKQNTQLWVKLVSGLGVSLDLFALHTHTHSHTEWGAWAMWVCGSREPPVLSETKQKAIRIFNVLLILENRFRFSSIGAKC